MNTREYRAAGGIVLDDARRVLLIERWIIRREQLIFEVRLPKGHVEAGETDAEAAVRETCEETGYCGVEIVADLGETVTEWTNEVEHVRRNEHYYLMRLVDPTRGDPHFNNPESDEARFVPRWAADLETAAKDLTFRSEAMFAERALQTLAPGSGTLEA